MREAGRVDQVMGSGAARFFEVLTIIGAVAAAVVLLGAFVPGQSAIQQGAAAAVAVALVAIPYCIAGALHRSTIRSRHRERSEIDD